MYRRSSRRRRAFTLLEIMIVVGILALLAAFVLPNLIGTGEVARVKITKSAVGRTGNIGGALDQYRIEIGKYPTTEEGLRALYERPSSVDEESHKWRKFMDGSPEELKDPWGNEYQYKSPGDFNSDAYDLWSKGPDGQDGTDDDITNWVKK